MWILAGSTAFEQTDGGPPRAVPELGTAERLATGRGLTVAANPGGRLALLRDGAVSVLETGIPDAVCSMLVLEASPLRILIGTEPPRLYEFAGTGPARPNRSFDELPCRVGWHTPWGGPAAVRSLATPNGATVYADIHVGSIMRSRDGGETWEPVTPDLHEDVHRVAASPAAPARVYANTAAAVYVSDDGGDSWSHRTGELPVRYGREIAAAPDDPDLLLATVSDGPHGNDVRAELRRSADAGRSWTRVGGGFPASVPRNIDTFHVLMQAGGIAWVCRDADLYRSGDGGETWAKAGTFPRPIRMLCP